MFSSHHGPIFTSLILQILYKIYPCKEYKFVPYKIKRKRISFCTLHHRDKNFSKAFLRKSLDVGLMFHSGVQLFGHYSFLFETKVNLNSFFLAFKTEQL